MADSEQDKSEQPTPYKLQQARRKGSVARGMDLGFFSGLAALLGCAWAAGPGLAMNLSRWMKAAFVSSANLSENPASVLTLISALFLGMARPIVSLAIVVFSLTLLFEIVQTGVVFSAHPLKPDFSRMNPAKGLKRLFSVRLLIETLKNIAKLTVYVVIAYLMIEQAIETLPPAIDNAATLATASERSVIRLLAAFALAAIVFAIIDQFIARRQFRKTMRMSRRDVRREMRDREGDPRLKQKRKQLHGDFANLSQSLRNLKGADMLIVNPQHVAVALRYDAVSMHAPLVVSVGVNHLAQRLKRLALLYGIPIIENPPLARALQRQVGLNDFVPDAYFAPVADLYNKMRRAVAQRNRTPDHVA